MAFIGSVGFLEDIAYTETEFANYHKTALEDKISYILSGNVLTLNSFGILNHGYFCKFDGTQDFTFSSDGTFYVYANYTTGSLPVVAVSTAVPSSTVTVFNKGILKVTKSGTYFEIYNIANTNLTVNFNKVTPATQTLASAAVVTVASISVPAGLYSVNAFAGWSTAFTQERTYSIYKVETHTGSSVETLVCEARGTGASGGSDTLGAEEYITGGSFVLKMAQYSGTTKQTFNKTNLSVRKIG